MSAINFDENSASPGLTPSPRRSPSRLNPLPPPISPPLNPLPPPISPREKYFADFSFLYRIFISFLPYKLQILYVCVLITQEVAKIHMSNHIYSESVCLREGFKPFSFTLASIFFTWGVFKVFWWRRKNEKTPLTWRILNIEVHKLS